tara:strand:+ start:117 stop:767 length:651 start_codon:yes stop_codon:yes gene_type:complete
MIHFIGDSHASIFSGSDTMQPEWPNRSHDLLPFFRSYRIGPATAYNIENKRNIIDEIINSSVNVDEDYVAFCFGEVDCRAHLKKQIDLQERETKNVVLECVSRYFKTILHYSNLGVKSIAWGPVASHGKENPYTTGPSFGTDEERNKITQLFNEMLKSMCDEEGIKFLTAFYEMTTEYNGFRKTNTEYTDSVGIHLNNNAVGMILGIFKKEGLICY